MSTTAISPASQVIERHEDLFIGKNVLITGDMQDTYPSMLPAAQVNIHCTQFHHYLHFPENSRPDGTVFSLLPESSAYQGINTLIYYWPKSKIEAQFQLSYLLYNMPQHSDIFIVGENRSGVRSAETLLKDFGSIQKIDTARRCSLYHFQADSRLDFNLKEWWLSYHLDFNNINVEVKSLPGVFSQKGLDAGSEVLLEALLDNPHLLKGKILDVGCGCGVLSAVIGKINPEAILTLSDVNAAALESSKATLAANQQEANVVASDVFSNITGKYDLIISNPPFHDGKLTSYSAADSLVKEAKKYLAPRGRLCIVANSFLPYSELIVATFGHCEILMQTTKYKVYLV